MLNFSMLVVPAVLMTASVHADEFADSAQLACFPYNTESSFVTSVRLEGAPIAGSRTAKVALRATSGEEEDSIVSCDYEGARYTCVGSDRILKIEITDTRDVSNENNHNRIIDTLYEIIVGSRINPRKVDATITYLKSNPRETSSSRVATVRFDCLL